MMPNFLDNTLSQMPDVSRVHRPLELKTWICKMGKTVVHQSFEKSAAIQPHPRRLRCSVNGGQHFAWSWKQLAAAATHDRIDRAVTPLDISDLGHNSVFSYVTLE
jgi:hypothetical protein